MLAMAPNSVRAAVGYSGLALTLLLFPLQASAQVGANVFGVWHQQTVTTGVGLLVQFELRSDQTYESLMVFARNGTCQSSLHYIGNFQVSGNILDFVALAGKQGCPGDERDFTKSELADERSIFNRRNTFRLKGRELCFATENGRSCFRRN